MATAEKTLVMMRLKRKQRQDASGTTADFEEVYREYFRPLYAFIAYRVSNRASAEDITSQVFEKALKAFPDYNPKRAAISTWLFTIARNAVSDYFRSGKQRHEAVLDESNTASNRGDPQRELEALETRRELLQAMAALASREHEVLALKFGAGISNREIGKLLGITESNTGTILYRSLMKLKNHLGDGIENE